MTNQLSQIKWGRVALTALVVYVLSFLTIVIIVTVYATYLAFQMRGAPDQTMIMAFANAYAPWIGPICLILFTFLGAMHVARRVESAVQLHGIVLGALATLLNTIFSGLDLSTLAVAILTIGAGWLGSKMSNRK